MNTQKSTQQELQKESKKISYYKKLCKKFQKTQIISAINFLLDMKNRKFDEDYISKTLD